MTISCSVIAHSPSAA